MGNYLITSAFMGYGHLRAAHNISGVSGAPLIRVDRPPYLGGIDHMVWSGAQRIHTYASRDAESRNRILYNWFDGLMRIQPDHTPPPMSASRFVRLLSALRVGGRLVDSLWSDHPALLHTFYLQAMVALYRNYPGRNYLLLCDTDVHRVWVPVRPDADNMEYIVPVPESADRLMSYGVPSGRIHVTGFPLPPANTGHGDTTALAADFEARKRRLRPDSGAPLTVMFPFSGAGAYSNKLAELVGSLRADLKNGVVRLVVSCGDNRRALKNAENIFTNYGLDECGFTELIFDEALSTSFDKFNLALKSADVIVTKPSEMVFYAALGIPMVFLPPIGDHEAGNREYLIRNECAVDMSTIAEFSGWLEASRITGRLLDLAEMGYRRLPQWGALEIDRLLRGGGG